MDEQMQDPGMLDKIVNALRSVGGSIGSGGPDIMSDSIAYENYRMAAAETGTPMTKDQWVQAGRPAQ